MHPESALRSLLPPSLSQDLEPLEILGEGSHGLVLRVRQTALERTAVLKLLKASAGAEMPCLPARFQREARVLASLRHPHLPELLDHGLADGVPYLILQDARGLSLDRILAERGRLEVEEVRSLLAQTLDAVAHLHAHGWVHRDLKPANLLQREDGHWTLLDFGLVRTLEEEEKLTATGMILGTPAYMSPQASVGRTPAPGDDVYALGVVAYESLTGENPFDAGSVGLPEILRRQRELVPEPLQRRVPGIFDALADLVGLLLVKDVAARPEAREAVDLLLGKVGSGPTRAMAPPGEPVAATQVLSPTASVGPGERPPGAGPRRRAPLFLALLLLVGLGAFLAPGPSSRRDPQPVGETFLSGPPPREAPPPGLGLVEAVQESFRELPENVTRDPANWEEVLRLLPEMDHLERWIVESGGVPPGPVEERIRALGRDFSSLGYWNPVPGWLRLRPAAEGVRGGRELLEGTGLAEREFAGWSGTALEACQDLRRFREQMEEDFGLVARRETPDRPYPSVFRDALQSTALLSVAGRRGQFLGFFSLQWTLGELRRAELVDFFREGLVATGVAVRATARALVVGEEPGFPLAGLLENGVASLQVLQASPEILRSSDYWLEGAPRTGRVALFRLLHDGWRSEVLDVLERAPLLPREHWKGLALASLEDLDGVQFEGHRRIQRIMQVLLGRSVSKRFPDLYLEVLQDLRPRIRALPAYRQSQLLHWISHFHNLPEGVPDPVQEEAELYGPEVVADFARRQRETPRRGITRM